MSITIFPEPSTSSISAYNVTATSPNIFYSFDNTVITAGVYRFTCVSSTIATIYFYNGSTLLTTAVTSSGTVDVNLSTAPTKVAFFTDTGSSILITFTFLASPLSSSANGTVDTLTTSQTYTQIGPALVVVVGGGGAGGGTNSTYGGYRGGGGASGGVQSSPYTLTGNTPVTIGSAGNGTLGNSGNDGGATIFGNLTSNGGGGGNPYEGNGTAGTPGGGNGGQYSANATASVASAYNFVISGTTGGGGKGQGGSGAGSGIGTGGNGGNTTGGSATGKGAGGGGGFNNSGQTTGGPGSPGVVYVIRGF
jgi:hypothetical protein